MKNIVALTLFILILLTGSALAQQQKAPEGLQAVIDALDKTATEMVKDPQAASFTIGLVQKNGLVWAKSYGYADIEKRILATPDSIYRIGSITKQFTAIMLLQLVHEGKVHLSDPVEKYFPEIHLVKEEYKNAPPITLVQLATHTAGLAVEPEDMATYVKGPVSEWDKTLIAALPHTKYIHEPGTQFSYSNIGYAILGAALSRAAHQPFTAYMKEKVLLPLGMTHSGFEATPPMRKDLATGYDMLSGKFDAETPAKEHAEGRGYKVPNGALYTTVGDLARFEVFEMGGGPESVLPKKELEENAHHMVVTDRGLVWGCGIGFLAQRLSGHIFIGHAGAVAGYTAAAYFQPDTETAVIVLRNESARGIDKLVQVFTDKLEVKTPAAEKAAN